VQARHAAGEAAIVLHVGTDLVAHGKKPGAISLIENAEQVGIWGEDVTVGHSITGTNQDDISEVGREVEYPIWIGGRLAEALAHRNCRAWRTGRAARGRAGIRRGLREKACRQRSGDGDNASTQKLTTR